MKNAKNARNGMSAGEHPMLILASETSVWQHRWFVRWWGVVNYGICATTAILTTAAVSFVLYLFLSPDPITPLQGASSPPAAWARAALAAAWFAAAYLFVCRYLHLLSNERELGKQRFVSVASDMDDPGMRTETSEARRQEIAETFFRPFVEKRRDRKNAVQWYDELHDEAGLAGQRASLIVEGGRTGRWSPDSPEALSGLVATAMKEVSPGEVEPVTLPVRLRLPVLLVTAAFAAMMLVYPPSNLTYTTTGIASTSSTIGMVMMDFERLGMRIVGILIVGYLSLRELGLFPLPLFRGECSVEKTRVFHRFRWKTFRPGRDLAIVRFTSNREADIAFLGADGSHATARVGGKYLDHFVACWASPVKNAECRPGAEAEASGAHDEGRGGGER